MLDVRRYYDLASLYGSHGQRGYNDAFTVALASLEGQIVTYDSPEDMAMLQTQLREMPTAELQGIAAQIAISGEGYGVVLAAGALLTDLSGQITNTEMADLVAQNAVDATELGVAMMQEIADKYGRGEPLTEDERWLLAVAVGGGMAATGGRHALNWLRTVQLPRFQRLTLTLNRAIQPPIDPSVNVASAQRTQHILYGDGTGGGHLWPGLPGKTPFPRSWDGNRIMSTTSDIATDPNLLWNPQTGSGGLYTKSGRPARFVVVDQNGNLPVVDGVSIKVIVEPAGTGIVTSHVQY